MTLRVNVEAGLKNAIEEAVGDGCTGYNHAKAKAWVQDTLRLTYAHLQSLGEEDTKFILTCSVVERTGAGYYSTSTAIWDKQYDGCVTVQHEAMAQTARKSGVTVLATVYWLDSKIYDVTVAEEERFSEKEVQGHADKAITAVLNDVSGYEHASAPEQCRALLAAMGERLASQEKPFKYVMTATLLQRLPTVVDQLAPYGTWEGDGGDDEDAPLPSDEAIKGSIPTDPAGEQASAEGGSALGGSVPFRVHGGKCGGFTSSTGALWAEKTDGSCTVSRDVCAGKGMRCILTVYGIYEGPDYVAQRPKPAALNPEPEA
jgi:dynein light chain Tctex-type 1